MGKRIGVQQRFSPSLQMNRYLGRELRKDEAEKVFVHIPFLPDIAICRFQAGDAIQIAATGGLNLDGVQFALALWLHNVFLLKEIDLFYHS